MSKRDNGGQQVVQIVLVHGIAQQQRSADDLEAAWLPSLAGGVRNAGHHDLADRLWRHNRPGRVDARMAFYGDVFLANDQQGEDLPLSTGEQQQAADELARVWLNNATRSTRPRDAGEARLELAALDRNSADQQGTGTVAGRALAALDRIPWFTRTGLTGLSRASGTLAQVVRYLTDDPTRERILDRVRHHLDDDTRAVIGHSLGSVVAYEAVCELDQPLPLLITLGSPLGLTPVNLRLRHPPHYPSAVARWVNLADRDDIVAARPDLLPLFDRDRPAGAVFDSTYTVDNGAEPHSATFYLTKSTCGQALAETLGQ